MFYLPTTILLFPLLWHVVLASSCREDRMFEKLGESSHCEHGCCEDKCCHPNMRVLPMIGMIAVCVIVIVIVIGVVIICVKKYNRSSRIVATTPEKPKIVVYHTDSKTDEYQKAPAYCPPAYAPPMNAPPVYTVAPEPSLEKKEGLPAEMY